MVVDQILQNRVNFTFDSNDTSNTSKEYNSNAEAPSEKPIRSIVKSISWRAVGTLDTVFISWLITGTIKAALSIGAVELFTKMLLYFFHERAWNNIKWGK